MSLERIKAMPVESLMADDAHCYIWATNGNIDETLEVMKAWGFRYITKIDWIKPKSLFKNYIYQKECDIMRKNGGAGDINARLSK